MTKVLIVDDHPMVAEGIQAILETYDDLDVVGTKANADEALAALAWQIEAGVDEAMADQPLNRSAE